MRRIKLEPKAAKFISRVPSKHAKQITQKIYQLQINPKPQDSKQLRGYNGIYLRADSGEYRIIYKFTEEDLFIALIGKRNDDEIYKLLKRQ